MSVVLGTIPVATSKGSIYVKFLISVITSFKMSVMFQNISGYQIPIHQSAHKYNTIHNYLFCIHGYPSIRDKFISLKLNKLGVIIEYKTITHYNTMEWLKIYATWDKYKKIRYQRKIF